MQLSWKMYQFWIWSHFSKYQFLSASGLWNLGSSDSNWFNNMGSIRKKNHLKYMNLHNSFITISRQNQNEKMDSFNQNAYFDFSAQTHVCNANGPSSQSGQVKGSQISTVYHFWGTSITFQTGSKPILHNITKPGKLINFSSTFRLEF